MSNKSNQNKMPTLKIKLWPQLNPAAWDTNGHAVTSIQWTALKPFSILINDTYKESSILSGTDNSCVIVCHYTYALLQQGTTQLPIAQGQTINVKAFDEAGVKVYEENIVIKKTV